MLHNEAIDIGIVTAMPSELEKFNPYIANNKTHTIDNLEYMFASISNKSAVFISTEIGLANASAKTAILINKFNPRYLFFSGIAGTTNELLNIGNIVVGETIFTSDSLSLLKNRKMISKFCNFPPLKYSSSPILIENAKSISNSKFCNSTVKFGVIASSDYFPVPHFLPMYFENKSIDAIDMESSSFAHVCEMFNKPYIVIRGISNYISKNLCATLDQLSMKDAAEKAAEFTHDLITILD